MTAALIEIVETSAWILGLVLLTTIAALLTALNEAERPNRPHRALSLTGPHLLSEPGAQDAKVRELIVGRDEARLCNDEALRQRDQLRDALALVDAIGAEALVEQRDRYREALRSWMPHDHSAQTSPERPINGCERCRWEAEGWL